MTAKWGIANIFASYNNVMITLTDITGAETLGKVTGGMIVKQAKDQSSPYAAQKAAEKIAEIAAEKEIIGIHGKGTRRKQIHLPWTRSPGSNPCPRTCRSQDRTHRGRHPHTPRRYQTQGRTQRTQGLRRIRHANRDCQNGGHQG